MYTEEILEVNNKKIAYARYGSEWTETAILFFHGFTGSMHYFPNIEGLTDVCIITFDRPGIGNSEIQAFYTMEDFFRCINAVLDYHGVAKLRLIGHSAGGYYAQIYAQNYPERVESLSLLSSMVPYNCPETKEIVDNKTTWNNFLILHMKGISKFVFKKASQGITTNFNSQFERMLKTVSEKERGFITGNYDLIKNAILNAVKNDGLGIYYDAYSLCRKREHVCISSAIPLFIWNGTNDDVTPVSYAEYLAKKYAAKEVHIVEGLGHMMYLTLWKEIVYEALQLQDKC